MRVMIFVLAISAGAMAQAHTGHLAEVAGHGHWLGAAAIGAAIAIGLWASAKGKSDKAEADETEVADDEELQEA